MFTGVDPQVSFHILLRPKWLFTFWARGKLFSCMNFLVARPCAFVGETFFTERTAKRLFSTVIIHMSFKCILVLEEFVTYQTMICGFTLRCGFPFHFVSIRILLKYDTFSWSLCSTLGSIFFATCLFSQTRFASGLFKALLQKQH